MTRTTLPLIAAVLAGCAGSSRTGSEDPCAVVADRFVELARQQTATASPALQQARRHMTPMLSSARAALVRECRAANWDEATRRCLLDASSAAAVVRDCPITWAAPRKPTSASPPPREPCTNERLGGTHLRCVRSVKSGHRPKAVRFSPDGKQLWVALHYDRPAVEVFDTTTWALTGAVDLGRFGAVELEFSGDGKRIYASQFETATVFEIDRATLRVTRTLVTGSKASKVIVVSPRGDRLCVSNWEGKDVSEFDLASGRLLRNLPVPGIPRGMFVTTDQRWLYVTSFSPGKLFKLDLSTGAVTTLFDRGKAIRHIAGDRANHTIYVSDLGSSDIYAVDLRTDQVRVLARAGHKTNTIDLSPDGKLLFASNRGANNRQSFLLAGPEWGSIEAFDTATGKLLDRVIAGNQSTGLSVSPDGRLLAASDFLDNRINIYTIPPAATLLSGGDVRSADDVRKPNFSAEPRVSHDPSHWDALPAPIPPLQKN